MINARKNCLGFTLIELMVVIVILALLASIVGPNVIKQIGGSKIKTSRIQIEELGAALDIFRIELGRYPNSNEGLGALLKAPSGMQQWNGPYLKKNKIPLDPWGNPYQFKSPGQHGPYDLYSFGADNAEGGEGENQDVASWL